ncbi:MAG TPA: hypothetical protein VEG30_02780 [Terriglobales bacterium]|nr:hypothetical protein [Terriglobales bacterium]
MEDQRHLPYGKDYDSVRMPPEDLRAMNDLEEALRKWGRYIVTLRPEGADLAHGGC